LRLRLISRNGWLMLGAIIASGVTAHGQDSAVLWHDPAKIVSPARCKECHRKEYGVWENTNHALGSLVSRSSDADGIKERMGVISMKHESLCIKCHFTGVLDARTGEVVGAAGVSCESCHGAAMDWINVHNLFGEGHTRETETAEHRQRRLQEIKAAGMNRPDDLLNLITNCYRCHTVPHEKLVNVGEHTAGGTDFIVDTKFEEIRHNFLQSAFNAADTTNAAIPLPQRRMMRVLGSCVDLEYSLRGVAEATDPDGRYLRSMQRRVNYAGNRLEAIAGQVNLPELRTILARVQRLSVDVGQRRALLAAADDIRSETQKLFQRHRGESLDPLDVGVSR
jgi:Cytochrome c554 and c-prime